MRQDGSLRGLESPAGLSVASPTLNARLFQDRVHSVTRSFVGQQPVPSRQRKPPRWRSRPTAFSSVRKRPQSRQRSGGEDDHAIAPPVPPTYPAPSRSLRCGGSDGTGAPPFLGAGSTVRHREHETSLADAHELPVVVAVVPEAGEREDVAARQAFTDARDLRIRWRRFADSVGRTGGTYSVSPVVWESAAALT